MNFFSSSQRIASMYSFPLEVNGWRFLSLLVAFRNTATHRQSEIKQNRSTTKQQFSGEALSKQNIEDWLTSLSCESSRAPTVWSAIFAIFIFKVHRELTSGHETTPPWWSAHMSQTDTKLTMLTHNDEPSRSVTDRHKFGDPLRIGCIGLPWDIYQNQLYWWLSLLTSYESQEVLD